MITLTLSNDDAAFLLEHLIKHARHVENELVHTDKRALQSDIARDLERLERLRDRVKNALDLTPSNAAV